MVVVWGGKRLYTDRRAENVREVWFESIRLPKREIKEANHLSEGNKRESCNNSEFPTSHISHDKTLIWIALQVPPMLVEVDPQRGQDRVITRQQSNVVQKIEGRSLNDTNI